MIVRLTKSTEVYQAITEHFTNEQMFNVQVITKDGAGNYDWVARQAFPNAARVTDKFHVIQFMTNTIDHLRNTYRNKYIIHLQKESEKLNFMYNSMKGGEENGIKRLR